MRKKNLVFAALFVISALLLACVIGFGLFGEEGLCRVVGDTAFAARYSEGAFSQINVGMTRKAVEAVLGEPIAIDRGHDIWVYRRATGGDLHLAFSLDAPGIKFPDNPLCVGVSEAGSKTATSTSSTSGATYSSAGLDPLWSGPDAPLRNMTAAEVLRLRGEPDQRIADWPNREIWQYTTSPSGSHYIRRFVCFDRSTGLVEGIMMGVHWD